MLRAQPAELEGITPEAHRLLAWRAVDGASVSLAELGRLQVVPLLTSSLCMLFVFAPDFRRRLSFCPTFGQVTQSRLQLQVGLSCAADRCAPSWSKPTFLLQARAHSNHHKALLLLWPVASAEC